MTDKLTLDHALEVKPQLQSSESGGAEKEQVTVGSDLLSPAEHRVNNSRRGGPSKREMMEEMSRQRFPWDE